MTDGQARALEELREIEAASEGAFEIVHQPSESKPFLLVNLSVHLSNLDRAPEGFPLRSRERFVLLIPRDFPFEVPTIRTPHKRFAGRAHVQWSVQLCLYQAPDTEWDPADGMFGFIERLLSWLERAALDQLDPIGGALHPPATYTADDRYTVIPRVDTPLVSEVPWTGLARIRAVNEYRVDVIGWSQSYSGEARCLSAAAVLLPKPMPWEYPKRAADLIRLLTERGVNKEYLFLSLREAVHENEEGDPLHVIIGAPMRGVRGSDDLKQHLTAWRVEPTFARGLSLISCKYSETKSIRESAERLERMMFEWAEETEVSWCQVLEDRPEIVTRRDYKSPLAIFRGKNIAVWGCGALGAHVATHLTRAGAARIILRDNSIVKPGVLIRQPYCDADTGRFKVEALGDRLRAVRTDPDFEVKAIASNVLTSVLETDDWADGADIVFDCTASRSVRLKLEKVRKDDSAVGADLVSMLVSGEALHGMVVVADAEHSGGPVDVYRRAKIDICRDRSLQHFQNAFYPHSSEEKLFQPEPGCSSPTFVGSSSDAAALAALLLNAAASNLAVTRIPNAKEEKSGSTAWAHFVAQPHGLSNRERQPMIADFSYASDVITRDPRRGFEVRTSIRAWEQMERWVARSRESVGPEIETGGLSFGERNDAIGVIWVTEVDGPPKDSVARADYFQCGTEGTQKAHLQRESRSRGSVGYVGMWHTHPGSLPDPSLTDLAGMRRILSEAEINPSTALLSILGTPHTYPLLGTYVFDRADVRRSKRETYEAYRSVEVAQVYPSPTASRRPNLGLALSGGGSRAIAFHLGCMRELQDREILEEVGVLSAVSGGAVLAGMYAYWDHPFEEFEERVRDTLRRGFQTDILRAVFNPRHLAATVATSLVAGTAATCAQIAQKSMALGHQVLHRDNRTQPGTYLDRIVPPFPRWASRSTVFESVLRERLFGDVVVSEPGRAGLDVLLNATELRTGTAFRFGSRITACSRFGSVEEEILVATAVAASAAYPAFLPELHKKYTFSRATESESEWVVLTDGGVYDNLGVTCLDPTRNPKYTDHFYPCDRIISCCAGAGQWAGSIIPYGWSSRMSRTMETTFRKSQDRARSRLFDLRKSGDLDALVLPYLGMMDEALERDPAVGPLPRNFVRRDQVNRYPTDFCAMSEGDLDLLFRRGQQLTRLLLEAYWPS